MIAHKPPRHPDLLETEQAAAYMGVGRLTDLPDEFRPAPVPYKRGLYHRKTLDDLIERAAKQASGRSQMKVAS